jgi:CBS domain-containing membrane protein
MPERLWHPLRALIGLERNTTSHTEKFISVAGTFVGMLAVFVICDALLSSTADHLLIMGSIGASAVLLFAAPQGALSQPWPVIGGNVLSAIVGVSCYQLITDPMLSAALSVALAVGLMHYLRCLHPPGGATALTAVIGSEEIHDLGYQFVLSPVLINVSVLVCIAVVFNAFFYWRRYPSHLAKRHHHSNEIQSDEREYELTQEDFAAAMQQLDSYIDVTSDALTELLELAKIHAEKNTTHPDKIEPGHFYSNGKLGKLWSIRQIIDEADAVAHTRGRPGKDTVIYKVVAGHGAYNIAVCQRAEFRQWARFEVVEDNARWIKVFRD